MYFRAVNRSNLLYIPLIALAAFFYWRYYVLPTIERSEIAVIGADGQAQLLHEAEEGVLLLNFYAAWCGHCMQEMPSLQQAHQQGKFKVIGLTDDSTEKIEAVRARFGIEFPLYQLDKSLNDYGVYSLPTSFLLNADGVQVWSHIGTQEWHSTSFMNKVDQLLSK